MIINPQEVKNYLDSHHVYQFDVLPCGNRIEHFNNDYIYDMMCRLTEINKQLTLVNEQLATLKRQISAHDFNMVDLLKK